MRKITCPNCEKLKARILALEKENEELKRRLALYENPNVPSSQRKYPIRRKRGHASGKRFPGRPKGYLGKTRPTPIPDVVKRPE